MFKGLFQVSITGILLTLLNSTLLADIPPNSVFWLDADDASTIFDRAGVNPGGGGFDAANIARWDDKSGSGYQLEANNPTDTNPEWVDSLQNGRPGLRFMGPDALQDPTSGLPAGLPVGSDARRAFAAVIPRGSSSVVGYFNYGNPAVSQWNNMLFYDANSDQTSKNYFAGNNNDIISPELHINSGTPYIVELSYDGNITGEWFTNGKSDAGPINLGRGAPLNTQLTNVRAGRESAQTGDVDILELIVYNETANGTLDDAARNLAGSYLSDKWGIATDYFGVSTPTEFTWAVDGAADWTKHGNWNPAFGGADAVAGPGANQDVIFGEVITSDTTVFKDSPGAARSIRFDNANKYNIAGLGGITLARGSNPNAEISVIQGSHAFQTTVSLQSATTVGVGPGAALQFNNALNLGGNTLTKTGPGTLAVNNVLHSGGGSLDCLAGTCSGTGTIGGDLFNDGTVAPGSSSGTSAIAVPEPSTALFALLGGMMAWMLRRQRT